MSKTVISDRNKHARDAAFFCPKKQLTTDRFVKYLLGVVVASYREFFERTRLITSVKMSKPERIAEEIKNHIGTITKAELVEQVPGVSQTTVQRTLTELTKQGKIIKLGAGRYIKYRWNWDQEDEQ